MAPMIGVIRPETTREMIWPNAAPMTTPIARSTTFPRSRNERKSLPMSPWGAGGADPPLVFAASSDPPAAIRAVKPRPPLPGGPYLVVGLARSGAAAALALRARGEEVI